MSEKCKQPFVKITILKAPNSSGMNQIQHYFPRLSAGQLELVGKLKPLYDEWNSKINLISRQDIENFYERHVLYSLSVAHIIQFQKGSRIIDIGTGGGFPGIPLAILFPDVQFTLLDSIGKKIKAVGEIIRELRLSNAHAVQARAEHYTGKFDFVLGRAVTAVPEFYQQTKHLVAKESKHTLLNGIIYLAGGEPDKKHIERLPRYREWLVSDWYTEDFFKTKKILYFTID